MVRSQKKKVQVYKKMNFFFLSQKRIWRGVVIFWLNLLHLTTRHKLILLSTKKENNNENMKNMLSNPFSGNSLYSDQKFLIMKFFAVIVVEYYQVSVVYQIYDSSKSFLNFLKLLKLRNVHFFFLFEKSNTFLMEYREVQSL